MSTRKKITDNYHHGAGAAVATALKLSDKYVREVLSGKYPERRTAVVAQIIETAKPFKKAC